MPQLDPRVAAELVRTVRDRIPVRLPVWVQENDGDPGITLLGLFAFLAEQIAVDGERLPVAARVELARIGSQLESLDVSSGPVDVRVGGERWQPVASLDEAEPDAAVFALDVERGTVQFGDGERGRRPPEGSPVRVRYRTGGGRSGAELAVTTRWPLPHAQWIVEQRPDGRISAAPHREPEVGRTVLERVAYFTGQLLTADDFRAEQDYVRARLRRLNRAAHGVGVINGLEIGLADEGADRPAVVISPGLAVDPSGEEIVVSSPLECPIAASGELLFVVLRFVEAFSGSGVGPGAASDPPESRPPTRIREGFAVTLEPDPDTEGVVLGRIVRDGNSWRVGDAPPP